MSRKNEKKSKNVLTDEKKYDTIGALCEEGGTELDMDGDSSDDANCIPLIKYSCYVRHIYTAMDRVGAPFCVVFWNGRKKRLIS